MKALSFRQPWAELVLQGRKTMDLRAYNTRYRGRLASVYGKEEAGSDTAVWLAGTRGEQSSTQPGIGSSSAASFTIEALREIGLLDELILTREGLVVYLAEMKRLHHFTPTRDL